MSRHQNRHRTHVNLKSHLYCVYSAADGSKWWKSITMPSSSTFTAPEYQRMVHRSQLYKAKNYKNIRARHMLKELDTSRQVEWVSPCNLCPTSVGGQVPPTAMGPCMWTAPEPRAGSCLPLPPLAPQSSARGATAVSLQAAGGHGYTEASQVRDADMFMNMLYK